VTPLALPLLALSLVSAADEPPPAPALAPKSAVAVADHSDVRLGEPFIVKVTVKHEAKEHWSIAPEQSYAPFNLRSQSLLQSKDGALGVDELTLTLALFQLGPHPVPDLKLQGTAPGPAKEQPITATFMLPGPVIKGVAPEIEKDKEKRDILGPVPVQVTTLRPLLWIAGALAAALLVFLGVRFWRRRPRRSAEALIPVRPPHEVALEQLATLEAQGLPAQGRFKLFHLELSEILRRYLGDRYGILALDMTTSELLEDLGRRPTDGLSLSELAWVCGQGDLAKFAKGEPTTDDCKQALTLVRQNVQRTQPPALLPGNTSGLPIQGIAT
jgi:hypothetical protein